jgi:ribonuclease J
MIGWVKPRILVPVHGEALHLHEHAAIGRRLGIKDIVLCRNGDLIQLAPGNPAIIDELPAGRLYKDGQLLVAAEGKTVSERRKLSFSGVVSVAIAVTDKGVLAANPDVEVAGLPEFGASGDAMLEMIYNTVLDTIETLPKPRRRDPDDIAESVRRAVRSLVAGQWGKKPICHVQVLTV